MSSDLDLMKDYVATKSLNAELLEALRACVRTCEFRTAVAQAAWNKAANVIAKATASGEEG